MRQEQRQSFLESLEARLKGPKPGLAAQLKMVPDPRPGQKTYQEVQDTCRPAAVLILLYPHGARPHLVLTLRTSKVDHHRDQVSLPGGEKDGRETIVEAALRETAEELGVRASDVRVLGRLTPLYIPPSNFCIFPVVAAAEKRPKFRRAPAEVAEIIELPLDILLDPESVRREVWSLNGQNTVVPFYTFGGHKIWGATAMVLAEFAEIIAGL
jgi:8-oxo-dGTP pyrophosphatase MutT (NUDIX family)